MKRRKFIQKTAVGGVASTVIGFNAFESFAQTDRAPGGSAFLNALLKAYKELRGKGITPEYNLRPLAEWVKPYAVSEVYGTILGRNIDIEICKLNSNNYILNVTDRRFESPRDSLEYNEYIKEGRRAFYMKGTPTLEDSLALYYTCEELLFINKSGVMSSAHLYMWQGVDFLIISPFDLTPWEYPELENLKNVEKDFLKTKVILPNGRIPPEYSELATLIYRDSKIAEKK